MSDITVTDEMVELAAKAIERTWCDDEADFQNSLLDENIMNNRRIEARAACEAVVPIVVKAERARAELDDEQKVADAYQIVGSLADAFGVHDHPEVVRAMDWLAYGKTEDGSDILPWPREPLMPGGDAAAIRSDTGGETK